MGSFAPTYFRGLAFLQARQGHEAAAEFEAIIAHRGVDPGSVMWPLAHLGLARARAVAGDLGASRAAYERFFTIWSEADDDLPVLQEAKREQEGLRAGQRSGR
jgi:hypothetical protein